MKKSVLLIATVVSLMLTGCSSDLYYANSFLRKHAHDKPTATEQIYVMLPDKVLHTNSSLNDVRDFIFLSERQQDSLIAAMTQILDKIEDSLFLNQFCESFLYTLSRTNIPIVLVDSPERMPKADDTHFTINIPQIEAEEFTQRCRSDFYTKKGVYYYYDYDLRHFATHVWLLLDAHDSNSVVHYKNNEVAETFHGVVTSLKDGKATMKTSFDRIDVNDAYRSARMLGVECATLYVEKVLTEYVCRTKGTNDSYFYYNAGTNSIDAVLPYSEGLQESFETLSF